MDFANISGTNNYLKMNSLKDAWKKKIENPTEYFSAGSFKIDDKPITETGSFGDARYTEISARMRSGQELSAADMEYLREHYPEVYNSVLKMEEEKKFYEAALRRCKTKDDARILHMGKVTEALSALKSGVSGEAVLAKLMRMSNVYAKFTGTVKYSKMAENYSELYKMLEAEKGEFAAKKETKPVENKETENKEPVEPENKEHPVENQKDKPEIQVDMETPEEGELDGNYNKEPENSENIENIGYEKAEERADNSEDIPTPEIVTEHPVEYKDISPADKDSSLFDAVVLLKSTQTKLDRRT